MPSRPCRRPPLAALLAGLALALAGGALAFPLAPLAGAAESCTTSVAPTGADAFDRVQVDDCADAVLVATPNPAAPGETVTLDGSQSVGSDTGDEIASYAWDFGDGQTLETLAPVSVVEHRYGRGRYTVRLAIRNADDEELGADAVELIVCLAPVAVLDAPSGTLRPGVRYAFDAGLSSSPGGGSIATYRWDFGDGTRLQTRETVVEHAFARDGASTAVTVTVVNDLGLASEPARAAIRVANQLPLVQLVAAPATVAVGQALTLDASGSVDLDGAIVEYRWDLDANGSFETSTGLVPSVVAGGYPNPGVLVLSVRVIDDSGAAAVRGVPVTVLRPAGSGGGDSGGGGGGGSGGSGGGAGGGTGGSGDAGGSGSGGGGGGSSGGSGGGGGSSGGGAAAGPGFAVGLSGAAIQKLKAALRRGVALSATANRAAAGALTLEVSAADAKKLRLPGRRGKRPVAIGTVQVSLQADRTAKPKIKLTRAAARAARRARPATLRVTVRGSLAAGADTAALVRVVLLRG